MKPLNLQYYCLAVMVLAFSGGIAAGKKPAGGDKTSRVLLNDRYAPFLINNIFNYYGNNGDGSYNLYSSDQEGFEFPKGSNKHLFFEDGVVWGGFHKGRIIPKVGGSAYNHGLQAGPILTPGTLTTDPVPADPTDSAYRIYRVRRDVGPHDTFASVQAKLQAEEVPYIVTTAGDLYAQYIKDWNEWPAAQGAPYTDVNFNGVYEPDIDIPGVPGADQTLWYVANDMNPQRTNSLAGSPPIGLEMQRTVWGYKRSGPIGNTIFLRTRLINKSGAPIDSMFLTQWSDPDLGNIGDDLTGCDVPRSLGYVYNGNATDLIYGIAPPAAGFTILQGPAVPSPGDSGWVGDAFRPGFKNLLMTSFALDMPVSTVYQDPGEDMSVMWYRLMNGLIPSTGSPYINRLTNQPTKFPGDGDPVTGRGFIDGPPFVNPGDRRMGMSSGPFTMAVGDTQDLVMAQIAAQGADRFSSITALRSASDSALIFFNSRAKLPPQVNAEVTYPVPSQAGVKITAQGGYPQPLNMKGSLVNADGQHVADFDLYDDGSHGDAVPGDGLFTGTISVPVSLKPLSLALTVGYSTASSASWPKVGPPLTVAGALGLTGVIFSDNINSDGVANPGENVRFGVLTTNQTTFSLSRLSVMSNYRLYSTQSLSASATDTMRYVAETALSGGQYFVVQVPAPYPDSLLTAPVTLYDSLGNVWPLVVAFRVAPLVDTIKSVLLSQINSGGGSFEIKLIRPTELKAHFYVIDAVDSVDIAHNPGFTLRDSTDGRVLLKNNPLPDSLGHNVPVTDGFRVARGTIPFAYGLRDWAVFGNTVWTSIDAQGFGLEGFNGTIGNAYDYWLTGSTLRYGGLRTVLIKFAATDSTWDPTVQPADPNFSRGYRYLRRATAAPAQPQFAKWIIHPTAGYAYQDYNWGVPFSAWDVESSPPVRLSVGHVENNVAGGRVDGRYWPPAGGTGIDNISSSGPREWFFIFAKPYTDTPDPQLTVDIGSKTVAIMWFGTPNRRGNRSFKSGDQFLIKGSRPPHAGEHWYFNPVSLLSVPEMPVPQSFALEQNYPNPFNPSTAIRFQLPAAGKVTLRIYDLLGREVALLLNGTLSAGTHEVTWSPRTVASGVYFYRLEAIPQDGSSGKMVETRKMLYIR